MSVPPYVYLCFILSSPGLCSLLTQPCFFGYTHCLNNLLYKWTHTSVSSNAWKRWPWIKSPQQILCAFFSIAVLCDKHVHSHSVLFSLFVIKCMSSRMRFSFHVVTRLFFNATGFLQTSECSSHDLSGSLNRKLSHCQLHWLWTHCGRGAFQSFVVSWMVWLFLWRIFRVKGLDWIQIED